MPSSTDISNEQLSRVLGVYAGMVAHVINNPERWLGLDDDPPASAGRPARLLDSARNRVFGDVTPASPGWERAPAKRRVRWWVRRIGVSAGLAAAAPRFAGALADRIPLQAALGASAAGLAVCATAREHGVTDPEDWTPLLARVVFDRTLPRSDGAPDSEESERDLEDASQDRSEPPSAMDSLGERAQRTVRILWRLGRTLLAVQALLDERPRGNVVYRGVAKLPLVGVVGGWLDERSGIAKAARRTARLTRG